MQSYRTRVGRWPLACTVAALAACADEPVGVTTLSQPRPLAAVDDGWVIVTNTSGGTGVGSLRWALANSAGKWVGFDSSVAGATIVVDTTVVTSVYGNTIMAPKDKGITISGGGLRRVFDVPTHATFYNVTITGGNAPAGSAIRSDSGQVFVGFSTVTGNTGGPAIYAREVALQNTTVSGNTGSGVASGVAYRSAFSTFNATVAHNYPAPGIGWIWQPQPPFVGIDNTIISNNGTPLKNCADTVGFRFFGVNISNDYSCGYGAGIFVTDPLLTGLSANGGATKTEAISHRSPALNGGSNCTINFDQRWVARDQYCDVGAFEFTDWTIVNLTIDANANVDPATGAATVTGTARCSRADTVTVDVQLNQVQKTGKTTSIVVRGRGGQVVNCSTSTQAWSITATPLSGAFQNGNASATAFTNDTPIWVTPAAVDNTVKLVRRK